ncbi:hypothetical protein LCG56_28205 (plasmid) [Pseudomonas cannabina pv. alisalensis]|uniref:Uncharacterized protein n=1 Tax=Pseudomonas syringae pv. maculicola str. ES4326 TaxID=629265 RepID=A0A8T8CAV7_PSEYM|nr:MULTISPECIES: hypothetical protein [Pseudomonas syringae group]QHF00652.1 hypothetical protein PMA4326_029580 [Pseudomonas syringae pv. maculicola str. ES4326]UBZ00646.1 hypothetical protein LCG56_28205 [Pseudomonas cannabina pv. alisalensis]
MNAQTNSIGGTQPLLERSKKWLMSKPGLLDVKKALSAIVAKVAKGDIADDDDSRDTYDALTEHYVDGGGDLSALPSFPDISIGVGMGSAPTPVGTAGLDYGNLYPDQVMAAPLSQEEKRSRLQELRSTLARPRGF